MQCVISYAKAKPEIINEHTNTYIISARAGDNKALDAVKQGYMAGLVTKDEYTGALRVYQKSQDEIKSEMRDEAQVLLNSL